MKTTLVFAPAALLLLASCSAANSSGRSESGSAPPDEC